MKKGKLLGKIFGIALVFVMVGAMLGGLPALVSKAEASPATIYVPDDYPTIQAAVDVASPGDTIIVRDGTYHESVLVDKSLTLKGEGTPVVSGVTHSVITVTADACTIDGFEITGGGCGGNDAGIEVRSDYNLIRDNIVRNNYGGIALYHCSHNTLISNLVYENHWYGIGLCSSSCNNTLSNNTVCDNTNIGIKLYYSSNNNIVSGNTVSGSNVFGIELWQSSFNTLYQNNLIDNARNARDCYGDNSWDNGFKGNYWSDYMGVDANGDGIGDTPYELTRDHGACGGKDNYPLMKPFARTWYVDDDKHDYPAADFTKIQDAVDTASPGDTIIVYPGTYTENVDVNKDHLTIRSENGAETTIVQAANPGDHVFEVTADYVELSGFTARGATGGGKSGIHLGRTSADSVEHCNISNNNASNNCWGIDLHNSSDNTLTGNTLNSNNAVGISLLTSSNNTLSENAALHNPTGIHLCSSPSNRLINNTMSHNYRNFSVDGISAEDFTQDINTSNTVDGKPIYYWVSEENQSVPDDAGYVGIVSCTNITIKDLTLSHNRQGVLVAYSSDVRIESVNTSNNWYGIHLLKSSNNSLIDNVTSSNSYGIISQYSSNNTLINNNVSDSTYGIAFYGSPENTLANNIMSDNKYNFHVSGIDLPRLTQNVDTSNKVNGKPIQYLMNKDSLVIDSSWDIGYLGLIKCTNITVKDVTLSHNGEGVLLGYSSNVMVENTNMSSNYYGIWLQNSSNSSIAGNTINKNRCYGILLESSSSNIVSHNDISESHWGIGCYHSSNNAVFLNNFRDNIDTYFSSASTNIWNSPEEVTYAYNGKTYTSHLGNYWSDYEDRYPGAEEIDSTGIWDTAYSIDSDKDNYPLVEPFENYEIGPENQPPVASFTYSPENPFSGDVVSFDASSSYDPEGGELTYEWNFGDGETATGCHASHRFRGTMNKSKTYTVTLTVEDNYGATATDTASITVEPLRKFVDVSPGYFGVSCWMEATYNWVGTDGATGENLYIISRINSYSGGFAGAYQLFILRRVSPPPSMPKLIWHIALPALPIMRTYTTPFTPSIWQEYWGTPAEPIKHTFSDGTFEGIEVTDTSLMVIVATGTEAFPLLYYDAGLTDFEPDSPVTHLKAEELKEMWELKDVIDLLNKVIGILFSPGELRIYDSEGRVTGLVNGEIKEEIPGSMYTDGVILILYPVEPYRYETVGMDEGTYGLEVTSVKDGDPATFAATDIPTTTGAVHQYTIDWDALSEGENGVTVQIDSDGDGVFERTFTSDEELTQDEFLPQFQGCFIATAAYGTPMAQEIEILREFRDEYLLTNSMGQALVDFYYKVSPPIAEFITEHPNLKFVVRAGLVPAVVMSTVAVNTTPAEKTVIVGLLVLVSVALAVWVMRRRRRGPEYT